MKKSILVVIFLFIVSSAGLFSQSGMRFPELSKRLEIYFHKDLISDIQNQLPKGGDFQIWGWDVGDFSGDGNNDVALSIKVATQKGRTIQVFLFVDIDGYLVKVGQYPFDFVELPLEIGVSIRDNACFVTQKNKQYDWVIRGYRFDNGSIIHLDEYKTKRVGALTYQSYRNFQNLKNYDKYFNTNSGKIQFFSEYMTVPSYYRGRLVYKGYKSETDCDDINYVPIGAYFWKGTQDLSFSVSSAYDEQYLYMTVTVVDDAVVGQVCDTCFNDNIELWLDLFNGGKNSNRLWTAKGDDVKFREKADSGIFCFEINPGDFLDRQASVKVRTSDKLDAVRKLNTKNIKIVSDLTDDGYIVKFKIPFVLLGIDIANMTSIQEYGCSVIVNDIDNEFRPEEKTVHGMSIFNPEKPSTYGSLLIIPNKQWYGETENIYKEEIHKTLLEWGY